MKDLPQGFITASIHLHQVCGGEAIVVLVLCYLRGKILKRWFSVSEVSALVSCWSQFCLLHYQKMLNFPLSYLVCLLLFGHLCPTLMNSGGSFPSGKTTPSSFIWIKKPRAVLKLVRTGKPYFSPIWFTSPAQNNDTQKATRCE